MPINESGPASIQQGAVYDVQFSPQVGSEMAFLHPAVVVSHTRANGGRTVVVVPLTTHLETKRPLLVSLGLEVVIDWYKSPEKNPGKRSRAVCTQIATIDRDRFVNPQPLAVLSGQEFQKIIAGVQRMLGVIPLLRPEQPR